MIHKYIQMGQNIVIDTNSGAVHLLDPVAYRLLDFLAPPLEKKLPNVLYDVMREYRGYEIDEAYAELYALWEKDQLFAEDGYDLFAEKLAPSPVKAMCLNVSHDCNLRCVYCFAGKGDYNQGRMVMSEETARKAVDYLIAHSGDRERLEVDFFGGEPLLNFEVVKAVVAYARSLEKAHNKRFRFTITTNGLLLDDDKTRFINREMSNVVLSIDGRRSVHDKVRARVDGSSCYADILPKFQDLVARRRGGEYYMRGTFTKHNLDFGEDVLALYRHGFDQISIEPVVADPAEPYALTAADMETVFEEYERLAGIVTSDRLTGGSLNFFHFMVDLEQGPCAIKRLRGCGCGNEYVAVTPDGDVYPCHQFIGMEEWKMGTVFDNTLDEKKKTYFASNTVYRKPDCVECWAKFYCSGGCNANNYRYEGDVCKAHKLSCEMEKKRLECAIAVKAAMAVKEETV